MTPGHGVVMFFIRHLQQALASIGELWRMPFSSLLTMAVLGLSLALPATLHLLLKNSQQLQGTWDNASEITLFLTDDLSDAATTKLTNRILLYSEVASVRHISPSQALQEFKQLSGFGEALDYLDENPLPALLLVVPTSKYSSADGAKLLLDKLQQQREVEFGKLDVAWLEKLGAIIALLKDAVLALGVLLLVAVVLVIGNTIRLSILNRRDEIEVLKLVGATDDFIRRPFLYTGIWYGIIGGLIAWICVSLMLWWMEDALVHLVGQFGGDFTLTGLSFNEFLWLVFGGATLGWLGAYGSVTRHVREIEPEKQL
jgi:cell division transport system permease protein